MFISLRGVALETILPPIEKKKNLYSQRLLKIKEKGLLVIDDNNILGRGDLFIRLNLVFPDNILDYKSDIKKIFNNINEC